jgi:signal peptidase I
MNPALPPRPKAPYWLEVIAFDPWVLRRLGYEPALRLRTPEPKNITRELFETIVFVLILVLILQRFVAEAFVIPTGSMAETLYGDHLWIQCQECNYPSPLNRSPGYSQPQLTSYVCPHCGHLQILSQDKQGNINSPEDQKAITGIWTGDRVLVFKPAYDLEKLKRFDVPVFKWPVEPFSVKDRIPFNYIKRIVGMPNETLAVYQGNLYRHTKLAYPPLQPALPANQSWTFPAMQPSHPLAIAAFENQEFEIIRKSPEEILAQRKLVFDMKYQPKSQTGTMKTRWHPEPTPIQVWWATSSGFDHSSFEQHWLRYQHFQHGWELTPNPQPIRINDALGYNRDHANTPAEPVQDLMIDCEVEIDPTSAECEIILELNQGAAEYTARFSRNSCDLSLTEQFKGFSKGLATCPIDWKPGRHTLRFANFDHRLTVWFDGQPLSFRGGTDLKPLYSSEGHTNDVNQPARIAARGNIKIRNLQLWRDLHYTCAYTAIQQGDGEIQSQYFPHVNTSEIPNCQPSKLNVQTFYIPPSHYMCIGDNSTSSLDSRNWGCVPEHLLLGKAMIVYWPPSRAGVIK